MKLYYLQLLRYKNNANSSLSNQKSNSKLFTGAVLFTVPLLLLSCGGCPAISHSMKIFTLHYTIVKDLFLWQITHSISISSLRYSRADLQIRHSSFIRASYRYQFIKRFQHKNYTLILYRFPLSFVSCFQSIEKRLRTSGRNLMP